MITKEDRGSEHRYVGQPTDKILSVRTDASPGAETFSMTASGVVTAAGGVLPVSGAVFTATAASFAVGDFRPAALNAGTDTTPTAGTVYYGELFLPVNYTITGIGYNVGSAGTNGNVIVGLYNAAGAVVANSALAGTAVAAANGFQQVALTATYAAVGPALYYVSISMSSTSDRLRLGVANGTRAGSAAGSFGTLASITPPTSAGAAPIAYVY